MKKIYLFPIILAFIGICCNKADQKTSIFKESLSFKDQLIIIKDSFEAKNLNEKLITPLRQGERIHWQPEWDFATKDSKDNIKAFYFVPLTPRMVKNEGTVVPTNLNQLNSRKYLLIKKNNKRFEFIEATYFSSDSTFEKVSDNDFFKTFSGILYAASLDSARLYIFTYKNGSIDQSKQETTLPRQLVQQCNPYFVCHWFFSCPEDMDNQVYLTTTYTATDFCTPPNKPTFRCPSQKWSLTNSEMRFNCQWVWVEDPPTPPPPPPPPNPSQSSPNALNTIQVKEQVKDKPFKLINIPCNTVIAWLDIAKFVPGQNIINKLNSITATTTTMTPVPPGGEYKITNTDVAKLQNINNAYSTVVNLDYFSVNISQIPYGWSPGQLLNYIRLNINNFVDNNTFTPYNAYGVNDYNLWTSTSPTGAIVSIDLPGPDNGSVITSFATTDRWTFSTIHEPKYGDHPVSGNRDFGYFQNSNGTYTFYTKGVDRLTDWLGNAAQEIPQYFGQNGYAFEQADNLWKSFQNKINSFVNQNGGVSSINLPQIYRPDWSIVKAVLDGFRPLSDLTNDCPSNLFYSN